MNLRDYFNNLNPEQREAYAKRCGTKVIYLYRIATGHDRASGPLARKLAQESGFVVSLQELRPDIFGDPPAASPAVAHCS